MTKVKLEITDTNKTNPQEPLGEEIFSSFINLLEVGEWSCLLDGYKIKLTLKETK